MNNNFCKEFSSCNKQIYVTSVPHSPYMLNNEVFTVTWTYEVWLESCRNDFVSKLKLTLPTNCCCSLQSSSYGSYTRAYFSSDTWESIYNYRTSNDAFSKYDICCCTYCDPQGVHFSKVFIVGKRKRPHGAKLGKKRGYPSQ